MNFDYSLQPGLCLKNRYDVTDIKPFISVITPYYNANEYFEQTYRSVLNQTFPYFEWIIVNDGSTNIDEIEFLEKISETDPRIRLYHIENGGAAAARNFGIAQSTTDIFIPVDADDLLEPTFFEYLFFALYCNPGAAWAYTALVTFGDEECVWKPDFSSDIMKTENVACGTSAVRKKVFDEVGGYLASSKNMYEDWQLWLRLLARRYYPVHIEYPLFWYRRLSKGALSTLNRNDILKNKVMQNIHRLADDVPNGIEAIIFEGVCSTSYNSPKKWEWGRKLKYTKDKTRILLLIPHMERGGADKFNIDILANIDKEKYEIGIITTLKSQNEWQQLFMKYADDVFVLADFLDRKNWSAFIHYYITSRSVDIVMNISSYLGYAYIPWFRKEFPTIGLIDCTHAESKYWRDGGYPRKSAMVDNILEKTFVTNEYTREIIIHSYGKEPEKTETIYTGVDEEVFKKHSTGDSIRDQFGIDKSRPVVLYLCRICNEKRPFLMLEIATKLKKNIPDICFLVVGDGPLLDDLMREVKQRDLESTVVLTNKQEDILPFYEVADIFLNCSIKEGLAITTIEAMMMEVPVVSADVGGQKELVGHETGRLVPCLQDENLDFYSRSYTEKEIDLYVDAITDLLRDRPGLLEMGKLCRAKTMDGFTLRIMIEKLENEFDRLKSGNGLEARLKLSSTLAGIPDLVDDYLIMSTAYENLEFNWNIVWNQMANRNDQLAGQVNQLSYQVNHLSSHNQHLEQLRSYRISAKYHSIVNKYLIVRLCDKCLRFFMKGILRVYRHFNSRRLNHD